MAVTYLDQEIESLVQERGTREDAYAEPTDRYGDFHGALRCLIDDANLEVPSELQDNLFEEW